ncbi:hypothetical protein [Shewanella litorisediminis]|uniref:Uncharacterized protein n=1 Tax=Shewanella litorisediminis TaxID=1173586 RepID=A0ABX7G646_9GAMM|nr:hypothetical protein [Shewanella litorisediminis]MCL2917531.1 hypothetical protein [Shewanella litorisediminis]QRH02660.1 hypothetical protein JQC75_04340 [Shewanella litorisediminis]
MDLVLFEMLPEHRGYRLNIRSDFALFSNRGMKKNYKTDLKFPNNASWVFKSHQAKKKATAGQWLYK